MGPVVPAGHCTHPSHSSLLVPSLSFERAHAWLRRGERGGWRGPSARAGRLPPHAAVIGRASHGTRTYVPGWERQVSPMLRGMVSLTRLRPAAVPGRRRVSEPPRIRWNPWRACSAIWAVPRWPVGAGSGPPAGSVRAERADPARGTPLAARVGPAVHPSAGTAAVAGGGLAWVTGTPPLRDRDRRGDPAERRFRVRPGDAGRAGRGGAGRFIPAARVLRDGERYQIEARQLVPGDVLLIEEGDRICADGRLIGGTVEVDSSTLTGESVPVIRRPEPPTCGVPLLQARDSRVQRHRLHRRQGAGPRDGDRYAARSWAGSRRSASASAGTKARWSASQTGRVADRPGGAWSPGSRSCRWAWPPA